MAAREFEIAPHASGYVLQTTSRPPAIAGWIARCHDRLGNQTGWKFNSNTLTRASSRKVWPTPESAAASTKLCTEGWARRQIARAA